MANFNQAPDVGRTTGYQLSALRCNFNLIVRDQLGATIHQAQGKVGLANSGFPPDQDTARTKGNAGSMDKGHQNLRWRNYANRAGSARGGLNHQVEQGAIHLVLGADGACIGFVADDRAHLLNNLVLEIDIGHGHQPLGIGVGIIRGISG